MLETSARLLRLLSLFQRQRYWSGADLAARLEVTSRTLRRDVDKLRSLGYPIHSTPGAEGGYQLGSGSTMPPLLLEDEEAVAVALGLRCAATGGVQGIEEASMRAMAKMEQILPARLSRRVAAMQAVVVMPSGPATAVDACVLALVAGACRDLEQLRFRYKDQAGTVTVRQVEPHRLVHTGRRWYLVAWDLARVDWRTFRVDRMQARLTTGPRFTPRDPPAQDLAAYVAKGAWSVPRCRARVRLYAPAARIIERWPPSSAMLESIDEESCYLDLSAGCYESLAMYLLMFGVDFQVEEPPELLEQLRRLGDRLSRSVNTPVLSASA